MSWSKIAGVAAVCLALTAGTASADIRITEWMYQGGGEEGDGDLEFFELTNVGFSPIDVTGWFYNDSARLTDPDNDFDLSAFGVVAPGESVLVTESDADAFRTWWSLPPTVKVIGDLGLNDVGNNLGRNDEINIYDSMDNLIDRLTYGDQDFPDNMLRTRWTSGTPGSLAAVGANDVTMWVASALGDDFGSFASAQNLFGFTDVGSPGSFALYIPEPSAIVVAMLGAAGLAFGRRRRQ